MSEKLITDGTYALSVKEYTGELEPGQGIDITQNVISVTGKQDTLTFGYDENNKITKIDNHSIGADETVLWSGAISATGVVGNLADNLYNYDSIKFYTIYTKFSAQRGYQIQEQCLDTDISVNDKFIYLNCFNIESNNLNNNIMYVSANEGTKQFSLYTGVKLTNGTSKTNITSYDFTLTKIVGINRKA